MKSVLLFGHKNSGKTEFLSTLCKDDCDKIVDYKPLKVYRYDCNGQNKQLELEFTEISSDNLILYDVCPIVEHFEECFIFCNLNLQKSYKSIDFWKQLICNYKPSIKIIIIGTVLSNANQLPFIYKENVEAIQKDYKDFYKIVFDNPKSCENLINNLNQIQDLHSFIKIFQD
jgi:hypothetical protein